MIFNVSMYRSDGVDYDNTTYSKNKIAFYAESNIHYNSIKKNWIL